MTLSGCRYLVLFGAAVELPLSGVSSAEAAAAFGCMA
jgi:hypothetical protein